MSDYDGILVLQKIEKGLSMKDKKKILITALALLICFGFVYLCAQTVIDTHMDAGFDTVVVEDKDQLYNGFTTAIAYNKDYVAYPSKIKNYKYEFVSVDTGHEYVGNSSHHLIQRKEMDGTPALNKQWMNWMDNDKTIPYYTEITKKAGN